MWQTRLIYTSQWENQTPDHMAFRASIHPGGQAALEAAAAAPGTEHTICESPVILCRWTGKPVAETPKTQLQRVRCSYTAAQMRRLREEDTLTIQIADEHGNRTKWLTVTADKLDIITQRLALSCATD